MDNQSIATLDKILNAAHDEFMQKDYKNASLRNISKKAGVTTGALYGYFKNKEELFDALVGNQYNTLIKKYSDILNEFANFPPDEQSDKMMDYSNAGFGALIDYIYANLDEFKLILCHSQGTKYENLIHAMARLDIKATHNFVDASNSVGVSVKSTEGVIEHILITGMFSAFFELVIHDIPKDKAKQYVRTLNSFYHAGWQEIMGF